MNRTVCLFVAGWIAVLSAGPAGTRPVDLVDPRIDTIQTRWIFFASASRPFGMVSLSPDTKLDGDWGAGYIYVEPYIRAFSHIHDWQSGTTGDRLGGGSEQTIRRVVRQDRDVVAQPR